MQKLLLVEDDQALSDGIVLALAGEGYDFIQCATLKAARQVLQDTEPALIILDLNLPDGHGQALLQQVRQAGDLPIIVLTANDLETDIVAGLELGADDYITKPFSLIVLRARVRAQLRRQNSRRPARVQEGPFVFDFERLSFSKNGQPVELSKTEQKLLRLLVEHPGQTLTREILLERVWTDGAAFVEENALSVTIRRLRGKLEDEPSKPRYIKTVYGMGYMWAVNGDA